MEKIVRQSMLYDFYGELLTEHQKKIYEEIVMEDLSYSEIAKLNNISRQGVYDLVRRCDKILEDYEEKLQLVSKFEKAKTDVKRINNIANELKSCDNSQGLCDGLDSIIRISDSILDEF